MDHYDRLKVSIIPLDMTYSDKEANIRAAGAMFASLPAATDIAVLPELFSTGYIPDKDAALSLAEPNDGPAMAFATAMATAYSCAVAGSFLAKADGKVFNRAFFVEPSGDIHFYDKRHLFSLSGEHQIVAQGTRRSPIIRFRGWNIALAVCYDLRFPCWMRNTGVMYDLLIIPANWPMKRAYAWTHLLKARAIENQAYTVGANRSGSDDYGVYDDQSHICDYTGQMISADEGRFVTATLSKSNMLKYREAFPFWQDAD